METTNATPLLPEGTGQCYLAIFDGTGNPIIDPDNNTPIGLYVVSFYYEYNDEGPDEAEIVLETDNPDICTHDKLRYLMPLKLQWGWVRPNGSIESGPVRSIVVSGHKVSMTAEGVKLTIQCKDASFLLQAQSARYVDHTKGLKDYISGLLKGQSVPFQVLDYSNRSVIKPVIAKKVE